MGIYIHDLIFGIEQGMFWKRRIIEDADVDCRLCIVKTRLKCKKSSISGDFLY